MRKLVYCAMALALLASCGSDDDELVAHVKRSDVSLNFSLNASGTRAIIEDTRFPEGEMVGIYGFDATTATLASAGWGTSNAYTEYLANGRYTTQALHDGIQELKPEDGKIAYFQKGDDAAVVLYGYYPYDAVASTTVDTVAPAIPVEAKSGYDATDDYMYTGRMEQPVTFQTIPLTFKHAMGGLKLKLRCADETVGDVTVLKATVVTKKGQKGTMSVLDGTITYDDDLTGAETVFTSNDLEVAVPASSATDGGVDLGVKYLLFPDEDVVEKVIITLNRGIFPTNDPRTYEITASTGSNQTVRLEAGKFTTLNLVFSPKDMNFTAEIAEWQDGNEDSEFSETDKYTE